MIESTELVPAPFVLLFQGRSGSTHLISLIDSHPDTFCRNEILTFDWQDRMAAEDLEGRGYQGRPRLLHIGQTRYKVNPCGNDIADLLNATYTQPGKQAAGFKIKYPHQVRHFPEAMEYLLKLGERLHVIFLDRRNVLKRAVSKSILESLRDRSVELHRQNIREKVAFQRVKVNVADVIRLSRTTANMRQKIIEFAEQFPNLLRLEYDDLLADESATVQQVVDFLQLNPQHPLTSEYVKATPDSLQAAVANFDELAQAATNAGLEEFLL